MVRERSGSSPPQGRPWWARPLGLLALGFGLLTLGAGGSVLFGRGLGGIGTAQSYFEPDLFNAGDNVYMYWFVVYGALAFPGFLLLLARSLRLKPWRGPEERLLYCLTLATVVYGMTTNVVENAFFALVCGSCVRLLATPASESPGDGAA